MPSKVNGGGGLPNVSEPLKMFVFVLYVSMYVCMNVCMYVCKRVRACMYVRVCMYVCMYVRILTPPLHPFQGWVAGLGPPGSVSRCWG